MKLKDGFVSNSSSSSFILLAKNEKLAPKELEIFNKNQMIKLYDEDYVIDHPDSWDEYTCNNQIILDCFSLEYGQGEEDIERILKVISSHYNLPELKIVSFE